MAEDVLVVFDVPSKCQLQASFHFPQTICICLVLLLDFSFVAWSCFQFLNSAFLHWSSVPCFLIGLCLDHSYTWRMLPLKICQPSRALCLFRAASHEMLPTCLLVKQVCSPEVQHLCFAICLLCFHRILNSMILWALQQ